MPDPVLIEDIVLVVLLWVLVARVPSWLLRVDDLGLTLFQPYRGDAWPHGVQEDDDFRFDWRPAPSTPGPTLELVVDVAPDAAPVVLEPWDAPSAWIEDVRVTGGPVALARPDHVEVHRAGR